MQDVNVVVVFYSRRGATEQLALAAAVGAVQGRANIRLRRLPDLADKETIARDPEWKENLDRMHKEYVAPRPTDATWADAILVGMPAGTAGLSPEFEQYFGSLDASGKIGALFTNGPAAVAFHAAMQRCGFTLVPETSHSDALNAARLQGQRVAEAARSLKAQMAG